MNGDNIKNTNDINYTNLFEMLSVPLQALHSALQVCYSALFVGQVAEFIIKNANVDTSGFTSTCWSC